MDLKSINIRNVCHGITDVFRRSTNYCYVKLHFIRMLDWKTRATLKANIR